MKDNRTQGTTVFSWRLRLSLLRKLRAKAKKENRTASSLVTAVMTRFLKGKET